MRLTYLDEAGTSPREPYAVVAGVIVHGDHQLVPVEEHLGHLVEKHIPQEDWPGFVFHATDIWSGSEYFKDKEKWPLQKRLRILEDLADIPEKFGLVAVAGIINKEHFASRTAGLSKKALDAFHHSLAFVDATQMVERVFRLGFPEEYTIVVAEDRPQVRGMIKHAQAALQGRTQELTKELMQGYEELPYKHIRDTVHFAQKSESRPLQIADVCAFLVRGYCTQHPWNAPLFERLKPALLHFGHAFRDPERPGGGGSEG